MSYVSNNDIKLKEMSGQNQHTDTKDMFRKEGFCSRRSGLERALLFLLSVLCLAVIGLIVAIVLRSEKDELVPVTGTTESPDIPEICETADCAIAAARVLDSIDDSVDPCDDFYMYACGGWKKKNVIPEDRSSFTIFSVLWEDVQIVNRYLMGKESSYTNIESIKKAKDFYASCVDLETIEAKHLTVAIPLLEELGGWPVLGNNTGGYWSSDNFDLVTLLVELAKYNNKPLIDLEVYPDLKDSLQNIIYLSQPSFGLPGRLYYLSENLGDMREAYVTFAKSVAELFGADPAQAATDMEDMMKLETEIANISMAAEELHDYEALYNKMTITQLTENITEPSPDENIQFKWLDYISGVMGLENVDIPINESEPVIVWNVPYFEKLFGVLNSYSDRNCETTCSLRDFQLECAIVDQPMCDVTSRTLPTFWWEYIRTIANYVVWVIMKNRAINLHSEFRDLVTQYNEVIYGVTSSTARWLSCVSATETNFGQAVGNMFIKETFHESAKLDALMMIKNLLTAFDDILDELDWMDEDTKVVAREKADEITHYIGYPDAILDTKVLDGIYQNATIGKSDYFTNVLDNLKRYFSKNLGKLRNTNTKYQTIWETPPSEVNAFYNPYENSMMFPAGILQPPFYERFQPQSMNYGGIGMVIGHELTHGFDNTGRQFDKHGNILHWWNETIVDKFKEKAQCFVDQYSKFTVPEDPTLNVNGINTEGENIADNGGLKQSFRAYRNWIKQRGKEEPRLAGLNVTNDQLFFINFAQLWCSNMRRESAINQINTGVHSPNRFSFITKSDNWVIGTLQNSKDFAKTFKCPSTSYMNPANKCSVW